VHLDHPRFGGVPVGENLRVVHEQDLGRIGGFRQSCGRN
jgi:hypothetical protein